MKHFVAIKHFSDHYRKARLGSAREGEVGGKLNSPEMEALRQAHITYLGTLKEQGKLFCGGPLTDWSWAMDIYRADSEEAVRGWLDGDPFVQNGVFTHCEVKEWHQAF